MIERNLTRRNFLKRTFLLTAGPSLLSGAQSLAGSEKPAPNFVIIFTDDQGYQDLGCFGSPNIRTPNIDRMAAEGTMFTGFYVPAPLCSPSRAALMTGCYPRRVGLAQGVLRPDSRLGINPDETTIAEMLKERGYATGCIGKWHIGFVGPFRPTRQGFDFYYGLYHNIDEPEAAHFVDKGGVPVMRNEQVDHRPAEPETLTELYTKEAVDFINKNKDQPFFLYLAHTMPHVPIGASARFKGKSAAGLYGDVIECLDWSTGQILNTLKKLGLDKNTIVIYTSDNGPSPRETGSALPLNGKKHSTLEGGMRVPCVMWAPNRIPAGRVCEDIATIMDLYPTFAGLAGADLPEGRIIDGKDIYPLMTARPGAKSPHEAFLYHDGRARLRAIRVGKWKLHLGPKPALYDLDSDIGETKNVVGKHPKTVKQLTQMAARADRELTNNSRPVGDFDKIKRQGRP